MSQRERVEIKDGDARWLPIADETFDVVVSSLVLHNIHDATQRERAVREMARVLKPGGHLAVLDIVHTKDYARVLRDCGLVDVLRSSPAYLFSPVTRLVTGRRSAAPL